MWEETGDTRDLLNYWTFQEEEVRSLGWNPISTVYRALSSWVDETHFFFFFFLQSGSFQVVVGLWQGGCSWLSPALDPGLGGGAVTMVVTVLAAISVVPWLLLPSSLPPVFYHQHLPHESGEASFACAQPPALRPQKPSLVCWHLASQGNILPTYFSISFLKVVLLNDG